MNSAAYIGFLNKELGLKKIPEKDVKFALKMRCYSCKLRQIVNDTSNPLKPKK